MVNSSPYSMHSQKLRSLKRDLITWNREVFSKVSTRTNKALKETLVLEEATKEGYRLKHKRTNCCNKKMEIQQLAKAEETSWRQKSRCLWFQEVINTFLHPFLFVNY